MDRTALIHVGTHKTGSTSLQTLFTRHRAELQEHGILYPGTRVLPLPTGITQTNLAWELLGHDHFDPATGTLDQTIEKIRTSNCPKVLFSSEEFSCLYDRPEQLGRLKERLETVGCTPHIALVLRDPTERAESLFVTLVEYGLTLSYAEYSKKVADEGRIIVNGYSHCFDNDLLARSFVDVFGEDAVTCVEYDPTDAVRPVLTAFDWFFDGALEGAELDIRYNVTVNRVEELRREVRAERLTNAKLEVELERVRREARWLRTQLVRPEQSFSRRCELRIRAALPWHRPR